MATIEFVDTSILLNILDVPRRNQDHEKVIADFQQKRSAGVQLVLPITTVIETGNHIAQIADGYHRRECATRFTAMLGLMATHQAPWVLNEVGWDESFLKLLLSGGSSAISLSEHAMNKVGCGDICILAERDRYLSRVSAGVTAEIWTLDKGLAAWS